MAVMKKILSTIALLTAMTVGAHAQIDLGYCGDGINSSVTNSSTTATISCAMGLTPEMLSAYPNCGIDAVKAGFFTVDNIATLNVWVRQHLADEKLVSCDIDPTTLLQGWNTFSLDTMLKTADFDTLYIGYDYTQKAKSSKVIGNSGKKGTANSFWLAVNGKWRDNCSAYTPACIRAALTSLVDYDICLTSLSLDKRYQDWHSPLQDYTINVTGQLQNRGKQTLDSFEVCWQDDDKSGQAAFDCHATFGQTVDFSFQFDPSVIYQANSPLVVTLAKPNGQVDACPENDSRTLYYELQGEMTGGVDRFFAGYLLEMYTSLQNGFAPLGQRNVRKMYSDYYNRDPGLVGDFPDLFLLTIHQGYGPADSLRVTENSDYSAKAVFGPEELSFAPALSVNRLVTVSSTVSPDSLRQKIKELGGTSPRGMFRDASAKVSISQENNKVVQTLDLSCKVKLKSLAWAENPVIMAVLVENETPIWPGSQKDYYPDSNEYVDFEGTRLEHNVVRQYLVPAGGIPLLCDAEGNPISDEERDAILSGNAKSPEETTIERQWQVEVDGKLSVTSGMHVMFYVCNMTDDDRAVECVCDCEIEQ